MTKQSLDKALLETNTKTKKTHLVKTLDVSLVKTEDGSEQGKVQDVVTIPAEQRVPKESPHLHL